jgi:hypothetical protein
MAGRKKPTPKKQKTKPKKPAPRPKTTSNKKLVKAPPRARAKARAAAPKTKKRVAPKAKAKRAVPRATPSQRALATSAQRPFERALTDEEREAMGKVALTARSFLGVDGVPSAVVRSIGTFLDEIRGGKKPMPSNQDVRLGLGVLWGEQLRAQVGWTWVHLTYPDGFASYALVPDDRAFACFPLNRVPELMAPQTRANTSVRLFESIRTGTLPNRRPNAYLVIG